MQHLNRHDGNFFCTDYAGADVYEESIHLPLFVHDPTGHWSRFEEIPRSQLTSTVDLFPLLLTLAKGGRSWLNDSRFSYLAADVDWAGILVDPAGSGRDYIVSTSDEFFADESEPAGTLAPADASDLPRSGFRTQPGVLTRF